MKKVKWNNPLALFSHELKTPLSSLNLALSLLERDFEKHKDLLPIMKIELTKMMDLITDHLDLYFIKEQKEGFRWEWSLFKPLLSRVLLSFRLLAKKENIKIHVKAKSEKIELFMDSKWLASVLENLLSNAIQHSPNHGQIFIEYGLRKGNFFSFSIRDEGSGLKENKKIFQKFYTHSHSINSKTGLKNTGLGLSIAKAIVEAHGGILSASNSKKPLKGSLFYFSLPKIRILKKSA